MTATRSSTSSSVEDTAEAAMIAPDTRDLLAALQASLSEDYADDDFHPFLAYHSSTLSSWSFADYVQSLPRVTSAAITAATATKLGAIINRGHYCQYDNDKENSQQAAALSLMGGLSLLATAVIDTRSNADSNGDQGSDALLTLVTLIHDSLLSFKHPSGTYTQALFANTLHAYYTRRCHQCDTVLPLLLSYYLLRLLEPDSRRADIARLYEVHSGLTQFDWRDESSLPMKSLIVRCSIHPLLLRDTTGRKMVAAFFALDPSLIDELHCAVKGQLLHSRPSLLECYGEVYYRVWKYLSSHSHFAQQLLRFETQCLQDLMRLAISVASDKLSGNIRAVLHVVHSKRKQQVIDDMLARLYEPLLWRALDSVNSIIRKHALSLLIDVFPLQSLDDSLSQESFITQQLTILIRSLSEIYADNRALAVIGLCSVLNGYWELFPAAVVNDVLSAIIDRGFDVSAVNVRLNVVKGFTALVTNHLTHNAIRHFLPALALLLTDKNEKVQISFLELLLKIKSLRDLKLYSIVPIKQLLRVLQTTTNKKVIKNILLLISNSFVSERMSERSLVRRLVVVVELNSAAARALYEHLHWVLAEDQRLRLVAALLRALHHSTLTDGIDRDKSSTRPKQMGRKKQKSTTAINDENSDANSAANPDGMDSESENVSGRDSSMVKFDVANRLLVETVLQIVHSLWSHLRHSPNLSELEAFDGLVAYINDRSDLLAVLLAHYTPITVVANTALLSLFSVLSVNDSNSLKSLSLAHLAELTDRSPVSEYGPLIDCLFQFRQQKQLLELCYQSITTVLTPAKRHKRSKKLDLAVNPAMAIKFLSYCLCENPSLQSALFEDCYETKKLEHSDSNGNTVTLHEVVMEGMVGKILTCLSHSLSLLANDTDDRSGGGSDRQPLLGCLSLLLRLSLHVYHFRLVTTEREEKENDMQAPTLPAAFDSAMALVNQSLIPNLTITVTNTDTDSNIDSDRDSSKRVRTGVSSDPLLSFNENCLLAVQSFLSDMLTVGVLPPSFLQAHYALLMSLTALRPNEGGSVSQSALYQSLVPLLHKICYHLSLAFLNTHNDVNTGNDSGSGRLSFEMLGQLFCLTCNLTDESAIDYHPAVAQCLAETVKAMIGNQCLTLALNLLLSTMMVTRDAVVRLLVTIIAKSPTLLLALPSQVSELLSLLRGADRSSESVDQSLERLLTIVLGLLISIEQQTLTLAASSKRVLAFRSLQSCASMIEHHSLSIALECSGNVRAMIMEVKQQVQQRIDSISESSSGSGDNDDDEPSEASGTCGSEDVDLALLASS